VTALFAGRYALGELLGSGGMGEVRRARDTVLDRDVAVKLLSPALAQDEALRQRFAREARLVARLSHPGIVTVFDTGVADDRPYIVMELVDGTTLAALLAGGQRLDPGRVAAIGHEVALTLAYAHAQRLLHRDVKPANILLPAAGGAKLGDFGIALSADASRLTQVGTLLGTAAYLAPEQLAGEEATAASDVYALGACLYEALAGRLPRDDSSLAALAREDVVTPVRELSPAVPEPLEEVVMRCLARQARYRPSAAELARALAQRDPALRVTRPVVRPETTRSNRRWALALIVLLLLASLGYTAAASRMARPKKTITHMTTLTQPLQPPVAATDAAANARGLAQWLRDHAG
jgi:eukaryotic-like serine/threonine-protein kinase